MVTNWLHLREGPCPVDHSQQKKKSMESLKFLSLLFFNLTGFMISIFVVLVLMCAHSLHTSYCVHIHVSLSLCVFPVLFLSPYFYVCLFYTLFWLFLYYFRSMFVCIMREKMAWIWVDREVRRILENLGEEKPYAEYSVYKSFSKGGPKTKC